MYFAPNPNMFRNSPSLMTIISFKEMLLGTIRNEDFQRNTAFQCWNNVVMLCCAKNRRCEQFRVTSPLNPQSDILQNSRYWINPDSLSVLGELNLHSGFQSIVPKREFYLVSTDSKAQNSIFLDQTKNSRIPESAGIPYTGRNWVSSAVFHFRPGYAPCQRRIK